MNMTEIEYRNSNIASQHRTSAMEQETLVDLPVHLEKLEKLRLILCDRFPSLSIQLTISQDSVPFLHIWKPISKSRGVQGMPFLPCFHIIVTLSVAEVEEQQHLPQSLDTIQDKNILALFQLHSFHGKVLKEDVIRIHNIYDECHTAEYTLVEKMEEDKLQLCHGVEEIDCDKFKEFVRSCKLPLLSKIRSVFLIEQFMGSVVFRSRLCEFALDENNSSDEISSDSRCPECSSFQYSNTSLQPKTSNSLPKDHKEVLMNNSTEPEHNIFEKVYYKTSVVDMEAMAVLHEVRKMYERPSKIRKIKRNENIISNDIIVPVYSDNIKDVNVKTESTDPLRREENLTSKKLYDDTLLLSQPELANNKTSGALELQRNVLVKSKYDDNRTIKTENGSSMFQTIKEDEKNNVLIFKNDELGQMILPQSEVKNDASFSSLTRLKKKRGRPRKYHSRSDYLGSLQRRKESKKNVLFQSESTCTTEIFDKTCQICLYKFKNESCHRKDQERHEQALSDLTQPVACPLCNQQVVSKYLLTSHFDQHHSEQNLTCCCECLELIPKGNNRLRQHILKTHHTAAVSLVCPDCGLKCAGNVQFQIHMAIKHSSDKSYMCQHCGIGFAHSKRLQVHLRRNHQPRDLQCPHCDKKFETRDQAIRHLVVHTGLKPYKCVQCQYSSYRQCNVISVHFLKSHGRKGSQSDVLTDVSERDMMSEIAIAEVDEMLKNRKLNLKKELKINNDEVQI